MIYPTYFGLFLIVRIIASHIIMSSSRSYQGARAWIHGTDVPPRPYYTRRGRDERKEGLAKNGTIGILLLASGGKGAWGCALKKECVIGLRELAWMEF